MIVIYFLWQNMLLMWFEYSKEAFHFGWLVLKLINWCESLNADLIEQMHQKYEATVRYSFYFDLLYVFYKGWLELFNAWKDIIECTLFFYFDWIFTENFKHVEST